MIVASVVPVRLGGCAVIAARLRAVRPMLSGGANGGIMIVLRRVVRANAINAVVRVLVCGFTMVRISHAP